MLIFTVPEEAEDALTALGLPPAAGAAEKAGRLGRLTLTLPPVNRDSGEVSDSTPLLSTSASAPRPPVPSTPSASRGAKLLETADSVCKRKRSHKQARAASERSERVKGTRLTYLDDALDGLHLAGLQECHEGWGARV